MEPHHIDHVIQAAAALINSVHVTLNGPASLMKTVRAPSSVLGERLDSCDRIDILVYENHDPEGCTALLNSALGSGSLFHEKYGYYLNAQLSWDVILPTNWSQRLEYVGNPMRRVPHILMICPVDVILVSLLMGRDRALAMDLMLGGVTPAHQLLEVLDQWELPPSDKQSIRNEIIDIKNTVLHIEHSMRTVTHTNDSSEEVDFAKHGGKVIPIMKNGSRRVRVAS